MSTAEPRPYPQDHISSFYEEKLHSNAITCLALINDATPYLLSSSKDKRVLLSALPSASTKDAIIKPVRSFEGFNSLVSSTSHTSDASNTFFAASSYDGIVRLFNTSSTTPLRLYTHSSSPVRCAALTADCKFLLSGNAAREICIFDVETRELLCKYGEKNGGHSGWVNAIKLLHSENPEELVFASASEDSKIKIWFVSSFLNTNASTGMLDNAAETAQAEGKTDRVNVLSAHKEAVTCLAVSACGKFMASGGRDRKVVVFDVTNPSDVKVVKELQTSDKVSALDFSPIDSRKLASSCGEAVELFDVNEGAKVGTCLPSSYETSKGKTVNGEVGSVKFDKEGKSVIVGYYDGYVARYLVE